MRHLKTVLVAIALSVFAVASTSSAQESREATPRVYAPGTEPISRAQYKEDFTFLIEQLEARHPDPFSRMSKPQLRAKLDALLAKVDEQDAFTNMMDLRTIVASLGDSHTSVGFYDALFERGAFPMEFAWFGDELRIIGAEATYRALLGARLDAINGTSFSSLNEQIASLVPPQDSGFARKRVPWMMRHIGLHHYFGTVSGSSAKLTLTDLAGTQKKIEVPASVFGEEEGELIYLSDEIQHPSWVNFNEDRLDIMFRDILYSDGVYLVQYNSAWGRELQEKYRNPATASEYPVFANFADRILTTLKENEVKAMIFDLRANSGGSSPQGTWLAEQITTLPADDIPESIFVAVGEQTFSAAIINAMNFKQMLGATFIGTRTGGKANHFGEVRMFVLPNSGIELPHSTRYFEYVEGAGGSIVPEIEAPERIEDMVAGRDAVVETVRAAMARD